MLLKDHRKYYRNIIEILQVAVILSLFHNYMLLLVTLTMKVTQLYKVYRLQYRIEYL